MREEKIDKYFEQIYSLTDLFTRSFTINGSFGVIEVEKNCKYYLYHTDRDIFIGSFGLKLITQCKFGITEKDLVSKMIAIYPNIHKGKVIKYTYMILQRLRRRGFIL